MSYCFPSYNIETNELELNRQYAKENGLVLHEASYRDGREVYVLPQYQCVSSLMVRLADREDGARSCYQKSRSNPF